MYLITSVLFYRAFGYQPRSLTTIPPVITFIKSKSRIYIYIRPFLVSNQF